MNSKLPPVPAENRSHKGPGDPGSVHESQERGVDPGSKNYDTQGRQGNIKVNTTNQGYQQDR